MSEYRVLAPYTTVARVRLELPPRHTEDDLSTPQLEMYVEQQANEIDGMLTRYYHLPAPRLNVVGAEVVTVAPTAPGFYPTQLERLNRLLAADDAMTLLTDLRRDEEGKSAFLKRAETLLQGLQSGTDIVTYPFAHPVDGRPYYLRLAEGSPLYSLHPLSSRARVEFSYPARTAERERWS